MNSKGTDQIVQYRPLLSTYAAKEHFPLAQSIYSFWTISKPTTQKGALNEYETVKTQLNQHNSVV